MKRPKLSLLCLMIAMIFSLGFISTSKANIADTWWDPDGIGTGEDWYYRMPVSVAKPSGYENAKYSNHLVNATIDFAAKGYDNIGTNSIRVVRFDGSAWVEVPVEVKQWYDQDSDGGKDKAQIWFSVNTNDLKDSSQTSVDYYVYFDLASRTKTAKNYSTLTSLNVLCFENNTASFICDKIVGFTNINKVGVTSTKTTDQADLSASNLANYDMVYFGWEGVSSKTIYSLLNSETEIKNFVSNGGAVISTGNNPTKWANTWLWDPGTLSVAKSGTSAVSSIEPYATEFFNYPNANATATIVHYSYMLNLNGAGWTQMGYVSGNTTRTLYAKKNYGPGIFILESIDGSTDANASAAISMLQNSIYYAWKNQTNSFTITQGSPEFYSPASLGFMDSSYSSPVSSAQVGNTLYMELMSDDINNTVVGTHDVMVTSNSDPAGINVTLTESSASSGKFRGTATLSTATDDPSDNLHSDTNDTVTSTFSSSKASKSGTLTVAYTEATAISAIDFKKDSSYSTSLVDTVDLGSTLYIQINATDGNPQSTDRTSVKLTSTSDSTGITVLLTETGHNTGIFRGTATVSNSSDDILDLIGAANTNVITVKSLVNQAFTDTCTVKSQPPSSVTSVSIYQSDYATAITSAAGNTTFYIEMIGVDSNPYGADQTSVNIKSSITDITGINIAVTETGAHTGVYRGSATIKATSNTTNRYIGAQTPGETITVTSNDDFSKTDTLTVLNTPPTSISSVILKTDATYSTDLTTSVAGGATLYIQLSATGLNTETRDTTTVNIASSDTDPVGITLTLIESTPTSGLFRGTAVVKTASNQSSGYIGSNVGETITITSITDNTKTDTVDEISTSPGVISSVDFKTDITYLTTLSSSVSNGANLFIEAVGTDLNANSNDTTSVTLTSTSDPAGITVILYESGPNTGKYRGIATVSDTSNQDSYEIMGVNNDIVTLKSTVDQTKTDSVLVIGAPPKGIFSVKTYQSDYITSLTSVKGGTIVYIEARGVDSNTIVDGSDKTTVNVKSTSDPTGIVVTLTESSSASQNDRPFRGVFTPRDVSDQNNQYLKVQPGDTITISSDLFVYRLNASGEIWFEGEAPNKISPFMTASNGANTSGGQYIHTPNGLKTGYAEYVFYKDTTGTTTFYLFGRMLGLDNKANIFLTRIDSLTELNWSAGTTYNVWTDPWKSGPSTYSITQGAHILRIRNSTANNDGVRLDKAVIKTVNSAPTGFGTGSPIIAYASTTLTVVNTPPTAVSAVVYKSDGTYATNLSKNLELNDHIYVQMAGTDGDAYTINTSTATLKSSITDTTGINIVLTETGINTGIYRNNATIKSTSSQVLNQIGAATNESVVARSVVDITKFASATVDTAAALTINTVSTTPTQVARGQTNISVSFTVSNSGSAPADVSAASLVFTNNSDFIVTASPANPTQIAGYAQNATLTFTVEVKSTASIGANIIDATITAVDHWTGASAGDSGANTTDSWTVTVPGALSSSISAAPIKASYGQNYTVTMTVTNTGGNAVNNVTPSALTASGSTNATLVSGPTPASANIAGGAQQQFTWTYTSSASGLVHYTGNAQGTESVGGTIVSSLSSVSNDVTIQKGASLSASITSAPSAAVQGQILTVTMRVSNTGEASADNVAPSSLTLSGSVSASLVSGPTPSTASVAGGSYQDFVWTYQTGTQNGYINFTGYASGIDANSGQATSTTNAVSNDTTVTLGAMISSAITIPSIISTAQTFYVTMVVTNSGGSTASSVAPNPLAVSGTSSASKTSGPTPSSASIPPGASQTFTWQYTAGATAGNLTFSGKAIGNDSVTGASISTATTTSNTSTVQLKTALAANFMSQPAVVSSGQTFTVNMRIVNSGTAAALNLTPSALTVNGPGGASLTIGPTPASVASLAGGSSTNFIWTYTATTATGTLTLSGSASAADANASTTVTSNPATSGNTTVQLPAKLISSINVDKTSVNTGQTFTVTMTVNNTGEAAITSAQPGTLTITGTSTATKVSGPTPSSATIVGGGSQQYVFTYTAGSSTGTFYLSGNASGIDANSGFATTSASTNSPTITVDKPAALSMTIAATPSVAGVSDSVNVVMTVTNTGTATAVAASPTLLTITGTGTVTLANGPTPSSNDIPAGGQQQFSWSYTAASPGTIAFTGMANAIDNNTGLTISSSQLTSNTVSISSNPDASLASSISASPSTVSIGQTVTVSMLVTNYGDASASSVAPSTLILGGTGNATLSVGPSPSTAYIGSGQTATFTWTYIAATNGTLSFTGNATGNNDGTPPPITVSSTVSTSNNITIQTPASLTSSISIPSTRNRNQSFTVTMTVTNTGGAAANNVAPSSLTLAGTSSATKVSGPSPSSANIPGGGQQQFTWSYTASNTSGTVNFTGNATGYDSNTLLSISSTSNTSSNCTIQSPASAASTISTPKSTINTGQSFTITLTVSNSGEESINTFAPLTPAIGGTGAATKVSGPTPLSATISGLSQQTFTWIFTAQTAGTFTFAVSALGTANNSLSSVSVATATLSTVTIVRAAALSADITATPANVNIGQQFTVTMTINNSGDATANNVTPSSLSISGSGGLSLASGPTPASANITGGSQQVFSWVYNTTSVGTVTLSGTASGVDANSGQNVVSNSDISNIVAIQTPAALSSSIAVSPAVVSFGQTITVTMTVNNTGGAIASSVSPSVLTLGGTSASATLVSGPSPAIQSIIGSASGTFTWQYTAGNVSGTLTFNGKASGIDSNIGSSISSTATTSPSVSIQTPPSFTISITATPLNPQPSGDISVTMFVRNTGQSTANSVAPAALTLGGTSSANYSIGPTPANATILSGQQQAFSWTYTAGTNSGTVHFSSEVSGTDANSGNAISSSVTTSNAVNITNLAPVWIYPPTGTIGSVRSSASVRKSTVYIGSDDNYLYAINSIDGTLKWSRLAAGNIVSTPFPIDDGNDFWTVYFGSNGNYVYAIDENNQKAAGWAAIGVNIGNSIVSTTVSDGYNMYFGCYDKKVYAVSLANGSITWVSTQMNGSLISTPAIGTTELYIGSTDGYLYALNIADGTTLRSINTGGSVEGSPWVDVDGKLYIGSASGKFYKLNASSFATEWVYPATTTVGAIISSPWVERPKNAVYFGSNDGMIHAVDITTGLPLSGFTPYMTGGAVRSSPLVWGNVVYFGSDDGKIYAVNALTGALLAGWPYDTGGIIFSSPSLDFVDGMNDRIVIGSNAGKVFSFGIK